MSDDPLTDETALPDPFGDPELSDTEAAELKEQVSLATGVPVRFLNGTTESQIRDSGAEAYAWKQKGGWREQYKRNRTPAQVVRDDAWELANKRSRAAAAISEHVQLPRHLRTDTPPEPNYTSYKIH
ncbi:hypothetical protein [Rhodococcus sp. NPDC060176]|uniref:hypothetical protein n=1 Tax=Rhodococcus sp. NPDC060176 TaxID=3347062 RepID=UPI003666681F